MHAWQTATEGNIMGSDRQQTRTVRSGTSYRQHTPACTAQNHKRVCYVNFPFKLTASCNSTVELKTIKMDLNPGLMLNKLPPFTYHSLFSPSLLSAASLLWPLGVCHNHVTKFRTDQQPCTTKSLWMMVLLLFLNDSSSSEKIYVSKVLSKELSVGGFLEQKKTLLHHQHCALQLLQP